jgi:hypothetical protein
VKQKRKTPPQGRGLGDLDYPKAAEAAASPL